MKLVAKFNLVLVGVCSIGLAIAGYLSYNILQKNAREEVVQHAGMMMEAALAIRSYTVSEIRPLLTLQMTRAFLPQTVPAYAATQSFDKLRRNHPEYSYKEATLNPTNLRNRAVDWEADIVQSFRNNPEEAQLIGQRETPTGASLYLARPITIKNAGCLACHSTVGAAPKTMLDKYGSANGFGWKMNETIGAQIVSVPMAYPIEKAQKAFTTFMGSLAGIFLFIIIVLNVMLRAIVIQPVTRMAEISNQISMGNMDADEFKETGNDEISVLGSAFNRMRRSLEKAMNMLEDQETRLL
ncbi:MAG: signal protein [Acidithiobacillales bacterium SG8_45]|jgi:HAMP domain-containing protein|nr:MAG: signal protein [Acidithiobacillales bacterium SG8_45]